MKRAVDSTFQQPPNPKRQRIGSSPYDNKPPPLIDDKGIRFKFEYFGGSDKGKKHYLEDRRIEIHDLYEYKNIPYFKINKCSLFGILDGHGGAKVVTYVQKNFCKIFVEEFEKYVVKNKIKVEKNELVINIQKSIHSTFKKLDFKILEWISSTKREGSTATIIFIHNSLVFCGNIGDSKAILGRNTIPKPNELSKIRGLPLSQDHNCLLLSEIQRIENNNGNILNGRVNGILEVTRSFGDPEFKSSKLVVSVPSISKFELNTRDKFLILACDGLWSVFSINDAINFIDNKLNSKSQPNVEEICRNLLSEAILVKQAKDNVSAIIIKFIY